MEEPGQWSAGGGEREGECRQRSQGGGARTEVTLILTCRAERECKTEGGGREEQKEDLWKINRAIGSTGGGDGGGGAGIPFV